MRLTRQRKIILQELASTSSHPTASELYDMVRKKLPKISLGTVYRNLELMAREGLIRKLEMGGLPARYDGRCDGHYHVRCMKCGRVEDIPFTPLSEVEKILREKVGYELVALVVEGLGLCRACRKGAERRAEKDNKGRTKSGS